MGYKTKMKPVALRQHPTWLLKCDVTYAQVHEPDRGGDGGMEEGNH